MPRTQSQVKQYTDNEVDLTVLSEKSFNILNTRPFKWQLDAAKSILCGKDVILDVGTGCGKTLCFLLPLLMNNTDIGLIVSPLSALMLEQANRCALPTVAVCQETVDKVGKIQLYEDIVLRKFRQVIISPEIAVSPEFHKEVLAKRSLTDYLRVACIDEAHCISIWGGTFRPDYAALGILRGKLPHNIPYVVASATFPDHVLDDVRSLLCLSKDAYIIRVTNARPNIALSVRVMKHSDESKADLAFLIPKDATCAQDVPVTLVYCNTRGTAEECTDCTRTWVREYKIDTQCIQYYHAHVGMEKKSTMEVDLAAGKIRILFCTTALGMGCDLRNIEHVINWGMPTSFCSLVQEIGRAGRNFAMQSEAILVVPKSIMKVNVSPTVLSVDLAGAVSNAAIAAEALARPATDLEVEQALAVLDEEGVRLPDDASDNETLPTQSGHQVKRHKRYTKKTNILEAKALIEYVQTEACRRIVWNMFFKNAEKLGLVYGVTSLFAVQPGQRCCDNCDPDLFATETVIVSRIIKGVKRGKKKSAPSEEIGYITMKLKEWRDSELCPSRSGFLRKKT